MNESNEEELPLRLLFLSTSLRGGGAEYVAKSWVQYLSESGHKVDLVTTEDLLKMGPKVPRPIGAVVKHFAVAKKLGAMMTDGRYDAVVSLQMYPNLLAIAARSRVKQRPLLVISERNLVSLGLAGASIGHRVKVRLARLAYRRADHVIAISHPVAAELVASFGVRGERCTVVPNPALAKVGDLRSGRRSVSGGVEVVLVGRLVSQKRPVLAVRVTKALRDRGVDARLLVMGEGPLRAELLEAASTSGVPVKHIGWVERWFDEISDDGVLLLPSDREGFGNVLVEAAGAGVPCVAISSALGVADALVPGLTGELVDTSEPEAIATAVERAQALDPSVASGWLARFTAEASGESVVRLIRRLVSTR